jgi:hypothetical protein
MKDGVEINVDDTTYELLEMLAVSRRRSIAGLIADLIEEEYERIEPGILQDLRRPGAAIKRLYAAIGRPVPPAFVTDRPRTWLG